MQRSRRRTVTDRRCITNASPLCVLWAGLSHEHFSGCEKGSRSFGQVDVALCVSDGITSVETAGRRNTCHRRDHTSSSASSHGDTPPTTSPMRPPESSARPPSAGTLHIPTTSSMYVNSHTPILLQTAKATVSDAAQQSTSPTIESYTWEARDPMPRLVSKRCSERRRCIRRQ